ncbi:cytochrome P450 [Humibacillus xanthopallidus]|nr:cytochrome P450 [Humibacillus xanthopallidus]
MGRRATVVGGAAGVRLFYDQSIMKRAGAMPPAIALPLFGRGAVHSLDGDAHRQRKSLFVSLLMDEGRVASLLHLADDLLADELEQWQLAGRGVVYPTATRVYGRAVIRWAGINVSPDDEVRRAEDMATIVEDFATPGWPYARAWRARIACDRWATQLVREVRDGRRFAPQGSVLERISLHRGTNDALLDPRTAGVELLNVLRPTVAVARFASFAAIALQLHEDWRASLATEAGERLTVVGGPLAVAFAQEIRRLYPFVPALAAITTRDTEFEGCYIPAGRRVLLDVMATDHDPSEWPQPNTFDPSRFLGTGAEWDDSFVPQGGGRPESGHRCPGEMVSVGLLALTCARLAHEGVALVAGQDAGWSWTHVPARPRSGAVMTAPRSRPSGGGSQRAVARESESASGGSI